MFSKKATKIDKIFETGTTLYQIDSEDFVKYFGLLENINFKSIHWMNDKLNIIQIKLKTIQKKNSILLWS